MLYCLGIVDLCNFFTQGAVALSSIDNDHVCLCGSSVIDGNLKGKKYPTYSWMLKLIWSINTCTM